MAKIYLIYNKENKKKYVGQTQNCVAQRFCQHIDAAFRTENKRKNLFYKEIKESGEKVFDIFKYSILEECDNEIKDEREQYYIEKICPEYNEFFKHYYLFSIQDEIIKQYNDGINITNLRKKYRCRHDLIANILKSHNIKITRNKNTSELFSKKVYLFNEKGYSIKEWRNASHCEKELGINKGNVRHCCLKNTKENILYYSAKGYYFKYNNDVPKDIYRIENTKTKEVYTFKTKKELIIFFENMFPNKKILYGNLVRDRKTVYGFKIEKLYN